MESKQTESPNTEGAFICQATDIRHRYGDHVALDGVDLNVRSGQITALLGPNGSGKTTLFRLLCTLMPVQEGSIQIAGFDSQSDPLGIRRSIGIVFQSASLDKKLTVDENIACQAALYGLSGKAFHDRRDEVLNQLGIADRRQDFCEALSGGLKRRVELAKGMLHRPKVMLLDEPSTGLDPAARKSLWSSLRQLADEGTAVLLTTHLMEEADKADQVVIFAAGKKVAEGQPHQLRSELGEGVITVTVGDTEAALGVLQVQMKLQVQQTPENLRITAPSPANLIPQIVDQLGDNLQSISMGRPSLEDVFIARTGTTFQS